MAGDDLFGKAYEEAQTEVELWVVVGNAPIHFLEALLHEGVLLGKVAVGLFSGKDQVVAIAAKAPGGRCHLGNHVHGSHDVEDVLVALWAVVLRGARRGKGVGIDVFLGKGLRIHQVCGRDVGDGCGAAEAGNPDLHASRYVVAAHIAKDAVGDHARRAVKAPVACA